MYGSNCKQTTKRELEATIAHSQIAWNVVVSRVWKRIQKCLEQKVTNINMNRRRNLRVALGEYESCGAAPDPSDRNRSCIFLY